MLRYAETRLGRVVGRLREIRDARVRPHIPAGRVVVSLFVMALARVGSLHALSQTVATGPWRRILGGALPSADSLGRIACLLDLDGLREVGHGLYARLKRNKALRAPWHGLIALVLDGHEGMSSYRRCCPGCCQRTVRTASGDKVQHYHRYVAASLVGQGFHLFLDVEDVGPGEGEIAAALRLLARVHHAYPRAFDVVVGDALYAQAPFFQAVDALGKDALAVLKNSERDLHADVVALFPSVTPEEFRRGATAVRCWDVGDLTSWPSLGRRARVVRTLETRKVRRQRDGEVEEQDAEWMWVTTASPARLPARAAVDLGHARWEIENRGFNEGANHWHMNHVYRHEPRAMTAIVLLTMLAMNVLHAFHRLSLKPARRARETLLHVARCVAAQLYGTPSPAPDTG